MYKTALMLVVLLVAETAAFTNTDNEETAELIQDVVEVSKFTYNFGKYLASSEDKSFLKFFMENPIPLQEAADLAGY